MDSQKLLDHQIELQQQQPIQISTDNSDFNITKKQLQDLFSQNAEDNQTQKPLNPNQKLAQLGGITQICTNLKTDMLRGIDTTNQNFLEKRIKMFGKNVAPVKKQKSIFTLIIEQFEDLMLKILVIAAIVSTIVGVLKDGWGEGWMEGVTIFIAVILIVSVTAGNNYMKEKQFDKLSSKLEQRDVKVVRNGVNQQISIFELIVGDIMFIQVGEIFPVDGVLINGDEVTLDLSSETGESDLIKKVPALEQEKNPHKQYKDDSILVSGGKMTAGQGTMLVCTVAQDTLAGKLRETFEVEKEPTPLQKKLEKVANDIGMLGLYTAIATVVILVIHLIYSTIMGEVNIKTVEGITYIFKYLVNALTIGVAIIVVAVPEGLPLSVTIAFAYSVGKMKDENNLVRDLASCEIMGGANNICSDKTGTLTENKMKVNKLFVEQVIKSEDLITNQEISPSTIKLLCETICQNSTADIEWDPAIKDFKQLGSKTECGLLQVCDKLGYKYEHIRNPQLYVKVLPFSSDRKRMTTIYKGEEGIRIATKGAAEIVLERCSHILDQTGKPQVLTNELKQNILNEVITSFATQTLRTISIAYKDVDDTLDIEKAMSQDFIENDLTLIAIAGIKDNLRAGVDKAVERCQKAGITVRMVTGDNIITAEAIAKECGILPKNFRRRDETDYTIMEGSQFRKLVGEIKYDVDEKTKRKVIKDVENKAKFQEIQQQLKVLARAMPNDKLTLVAGLIKLKKIVAVTGDGSNDAPALKNADIGFAMGIQGTEIAKEAAGIILLDDNFCSIVTACKWGRNIYDSIRKFIQFQLTVNIVALFMAVLGATIIKESPLNSIQMLWVNLIMDTFASLALATEPPNDDLLNRLPYKRQESMVNSTMWKMIVMQSVYQIIVLTIILFFGPKFFHILPSFDNDPFVEAKGVHFTIFFQVFVFMQIINEINCRKLNNSQKNVFAGFFNNPLFLFIIVLTTVVQVFFVEFGRGFIKCSPLTVQQNLICLGIAAGGLIWGFIIKFLPDGFFGKINYFAKQQPPEDLMASQRNIDQELNNDIENEDDVEVQDLNRTITSKYRKSFNSRISRSNSIIQKERSSGKKQSYLQTSIH